MKRESGSFAGDLRLWGLNKEDLIGMFSGSLDGYLQERQSIEERESLLEKYAKG
jgi:hypothetical protein